MGGKPASSVYIFLDLFPPVFFFEKLPNVKAYIIGIPVIGFSSDYSGLFDGDFAIEGLS
jgi:hypothetical protein